MLLVDVQDLTVQITHLFQCPNIPTATVPGSPTPTLAHFIAYALHRTRLPSIVTFAALLLLQRLKTRFPAARGSSGHRLFISAFMIASKVICDDTYSNQSWGIVAQKMFALKEINQMEREMCGYLEWNLNVQGQETVDFEEQVRAAHGSRPPSRSEHMFTPETTPDPSSSRPIRQIPSPYKTKYQPPCPPSPPISPNFVSHSPAPHFASANSSLQSSPASDDCKTPSPVAVTSSSRSISKGADITRAFTEGRHQRQHATHITLSGHPIHAGW